MKELVLMRTQTNFDVLTALQVYQLCERHAEVLVETMIPSLKMRMPTVTTRIPLAIPLNRILKDTVQAFSKKSSPPARVARDHALHQIHPYPFDVFSSEDISALGNTADITNALKTLVPSYTATPATGDGSAFVRATSLRAMSLDQTLVLVNGKRWHRSALVHFFAPVGGAVQATYGENYDNPSSINLAANIGLPLMELGYNFNDNVRVVLAAANVFDTFIDTIGPPNANRLSVGLPYPRRTPANYEGGSWYARVIYSF